VQKLAVAHEADSYPYQRTAPEVLNRDERLAGRLSCEAYNYGECCQDRNQHSLSKADGAILGT